MKFKIKSKKFLDVVKEKLEYIINLFPITILMIIIFYSFRNEILVSIIAFVIGNYGIDYVMSRNTTIKRIGEKQMYKNDFDDQYFDFYHERKQAQYTLLYNLQVLLLTCVNHMTSSTTWDLYITYQMMAFGTATLIWGLYLTNDKKEKKINALIFERKKEWGRSYNKKEEELLSIIANIKLK